MFKESKLSLLHTTKIQADRGYQGIQDIHKNSDIPVKKNKKIPLTKAQKRENRTLSQTRVSVENVIRTLKIFRILSERYRNRRKRLGLRLNLVAPICNLHLC
jgi:hypothetical protein